MSLAEVHSPRAYSLLLMSGPRMAYWRAAATRSCSRLVRLRAEAADHSPATARPILVSEMSTRITRTVAAGKARDSHYSGVAG